MSTNHNTVAARAQLAYLKGKQKQTCGDGLAGGGFWTLSRRARIQFVLYLGKKHLTVAGDFKFIWKQWKAVSYPLPPSLSISNATDNVVINNP